MRPHRRTLLASSLLGIVIALPALGQEAAVTYPLPCDAAKVTKGDVERAHTVFLSGKQYLEESNYDKAISYFNDAYAIDCSIHAILPIIATAYERKGDKGEAIRALEEYLRRAPSAPDHEVIERRIKNLKDQLAHEPPPTPAPGIPSASAAAAPGPSAEPVPAAPVPSVSPAATSAAAAGTAEPHHSAGPWIVAGTGGAVFLAGAGVWLAGTLQVSSASSSCPTRANCAASVVSKGNDGRTLIDVGYAVGGGGLAILGAGLIWHFIEGDSAQRSASTGATHATPVIAPGFAGVAITGSL
jgi:tetratricopeptide (TPR) repeat protein